MADYIHENYDVSRSAYLRIAPPCAKLAALPSAEGRAGGEPAHNERSRRVAHGEFVRGLAPDTLVTRVPGFREDRAQTREI